MYHTRALVALAAALATLLVASPADAYIGPGAGFAVMSSFLVVFVTLLAVVASVLAWPFRALWRAVRGSGPPPSAIGRLIVLGFDGQDPVLTDRFMQEGLLPNFAALAKQGTYRRLQTTYPALSPVAWSSFSTGTHPARHNIFDFLDRDRRTYLPRLSSTRIGKVERFFRLGKYLIPRHRPELTNLRRSTPFWTLLGERRIWSTILRVPITFPPDRFYGAELSAMCVPDLLGTQGTFLLFTTRPATGRFKEGGIRVPITERDGRIDAVVTGPDNGFVAGTPPLEAPFSLLLDRAGRRATLTVGDERVPLALGRLSGWVSIRFPAAPGVTVAGIARCQLLEIDEHVSLYVSPINLDPEQPAMPISHPSYYAGYLAKRQGPYATLGLAEDTWALNEGVTDDATFLQQAHDIDDERRTMCLAALDQLRRGTLTCVFDATDRIQHMFWRYLDASHPAHRADVPDPHKHAIRELYRKNDALVGEVRGQAATRRRADGAVGPRLQRLPARREPERVAAAGRLPDAAARTRRVGRVAARRRLDQDAGLLRRPERDVPEPARPRARGHRRPGRRGRGAQGRDRRQAARPARRRARRGRRPRGLRHGRALQRTLSRERARPHHRLQRRLPGVVGRRDRRGVGAGVRGQHARRGAATTASTRAWCPACCSATARSPPTASCRSSTSRRRRCSCSGCSHRRTWTAGRGPSRHERARRAGRLAALAAAARRCWSRRAVRVTRRPAAG